MIALFRRKPASAPGPCPVGRLTAIARTHVGRVRLANEDRFLVRSDRGLWAVADGMGGHDAGAAAAGTAIDILDQLADRSGDIHEDDILGALELANRAIYQTNSSLGQTGGTTIVVARHEQERVTIYWAGDSRAYWIGDSEAKLLTRDHSLVQEWVDAGMLTDEMARTHPQSNVITRALGVGEAVSIDRVSCTFSPGARILLCSDGLSRSQKINDLIAAKRSLGDFADHLLTTALQRDGSDNVTLVALEQRAE